MSVDSKELDIESEIWHILDGKPLRYLTIKLSAAREKLEKPRPDRWCRLIVKLLRSFGPMSRFAGNNGARTAHVAPYSHERFTPLDPLFLSRQMHEYQARALTGGKNRRSSKQSVAQRERSRRPSAPHKTPRENTSRTTPFAED